MDKCRKKRGQRPVLSIFYGKFLLVFLCIQVSGEQLTADQLNRMTINTGLFGTFNIYVKPKSSTGVGQACLGKVTPNDVKGPFHLDHENVNDIPNSGKNFPKRSTMCIEPAQLDTLYCYQNQTCLDHLYQSGIPLLLNGTVRDTNCNKVDNIVVDAWQADPYGYYWEENGWDKRHKRRLGETSNRFRYNCRAHHTTARDGTFRFTTLLPGHYLRRPRHIHVRLHGNNLYEEVVTQIYFNGDPYAGKNDQACRSCKSGNPLLIVNLTRSNNNQDFVLSELADDKALTNDSLPSAVVATTVSPTTLVATTGSPTATFASTSVAEYLSPLPHHHLLYILCTCVFSIL